MDNNIWFYIVKLMNVIRIMFSRNKYIGMFRFTNMRLTTTFTLHVYIMKFT